VPRTRTCFSAVLFAFASLRCLHLRYMLACPQLRLIHCSPLRISLPFQRVQLFITISSFITNSRDHNSQLTTSTTTLSFSRAYRFLLGAAARRQSPTITANMSWLKSLNPTPAFPAHTGPYKVGSLDVEIPTSELKNPSPESPPRDIPTVAFRVFYPAKPESNQSGPSWIASPQREYVSAYAKFLGARNALADVFA
jgi:hypothetical protein